MKRSECMVCSGERLVEFIDLGDQPNGNNFLPADRVADEVSFPLAMVVCQDCWEVQISEFPPQEVLFSDHPYLSGVNAPVVAHFEQLAARVVYKLGLKPNDLVIDVGCNDGTLPGLRKRRNTVGFGSVPQRRSHVYSHRAFEKVPSPAQTATATLKRSFHRAPRRSSAPYLFVATAAIHSSEARMSRRSAWARCTRI